MMVAGTASGAAVRPAPKPRYGRKAGYVNGPTRQRNYAWARIKALEGIATDAELARRLGLPESTVKDALLWVRLNPEPGREGDCPAGERMPDGTLFSADEAADLLTTVCRTDAAGRTYGEIPEFRDQIAARTISAN